MPEFDQDKFYTELDELYAKGILADVEAFLLDKIDVSQKNQGGRSAELLVYANEIAALYRGLSRFEESFRYYDEAEEILLFLFGEYSTQYATLLNNKAGAYRMSGDNENALSIFNKALSIYKEIEETDAYLIAGILNNISGLYQNIDRSKEAADALLTAIELLKGATGISDELATTTANLASIYRAMGDADLAVSTLDEAERLFKELPYDSVHYPAALNLRGIIELDKGNLRAAIDAFELGAEKVNKVFSKNNDYATMKNNLGDLYESIGDTDKAIQEFKEARSAFLNNLGEDCKAAKEIGMKIDRCIKKNESDKGN